MSWFEHKGMKIYYEEQGSGEPMLLLPGWGGTIEEFQGLRNVLSERFRLIAADLPGSGRSGPQPRDYQAGYYQEDADTFLALLDHLDCSPAHLMGFSDGGEDALLMAAIRPDCARSVVTWGAAGRLEAPEGMLEVFASLIDAPIPPLAGFSEYMKSAYGESNARAMVHSEAAALAAMIKAGGDVSFSRAGAIKCPVLLITGEHDPFAPPSLVSQTAAAIRGSSFIEAKGAGHDVHAARPDWHAQTLLDWLAKTSTRSLMTP